MSDTTPEQLLTIPVLDGCAEHLAGGALADGTDAELDEFCDQLAFGLLASELRPLAADVLTATATAARRVLDAAELDAGEFAAALRRLAGLEVRAQRRLEALSPLTDAEVDRRLRDGAVADAAMAAAFFGGYESFPGRIAAAD